MIKHSEPQNPTKTIHFRGSLSIKHVRGHWFPSMRDGSFVVVWGRFNHCFAYLHDFDSLSRNLLIEQCKRCIDNAEYPHGLPIWRT
jgi:hypothetical protein